MDEVGRAIERDTLGEHERQAEFRSHEDFAPLLQFICEQYRIEKSDLYLLRVIPDQFDEEFLIWVWPDRVVGLEIAYDGSGFEIVRTETIHTHKKRLRGYDAKHFKIIEHIALSEHGQSRLQR